MGKMMIDLPDYQVSGNSDVTVFLLHGLFGSKDYWRFHTERLLQQGYRVVAWDAPGFGLSPLPANFSLPALAEAHARLVRAVGSKVNILHGHSMGGQLTPKIYSLVPDRIAAVVIVSTIGYFGNRTPAEQEAFIRDRAAAMSEAKTAADGARSLVKSMFGPNASGEEVELVQAVASRTRPATATAALEAVRTYPEAEAVAAIKSIKVPTLLVAGALDTTGHPEGMRRVQAMIPGAEFGVVEDSGHYPWAEQPAQFNGFLHDFLRRAVG